MNTKPRIKYLEFSKNMPVLKGWRRTFYVARAVVEAPFFAALAIAMKAPGLRFRWRCFKLGLRLLFVSGMFSEAYRFIVAPMDSVRHFEMEFFWEKSASLQAGEVLDVSSPRAFSLVMLQERSNIQTTFINPDGDDLARTIRLAKALNVDGRCKFLQQTIANANVAFGRYELVVCMSVLEHIVDDHEAITRMWSLVAPGGKLLISVPCAAEAVVERTNLDEYGLLEQDRDGFVFWQRYYDDEGIQRLIALLGFPTGMKIMGEREAGIYDADVFEKRTKPDYPRWREQFRTARWYKNFHAIEELPGMGVVAMEFSKPKSVASKRDVGPMP